MAPRTALKNSRWLQVSPRGSKSGSRWLQIAPRGSKSGSRRLQVAPKMAPRSTRLEPIRGIPAISNAIVERGFSLMNLIKTDQRSRMLDDLLDSYLAIKFNGPDPKEMSFSFNFYLDAQEHWRNQKKRFYV